MPCCTPWPWPSAIDARLTVMHVAPPEAQTPIPMEPVPLEMDWQKRRAAESMARLEGFEALHMYPHDRVLKQGNPWAEISACNRRP